MTNLDTTPLWPKSRVESIYQWGAFAGKLGAEYPLARPFLICIRGVEPFKSESHPLVHAPVYDDCFVFIAPNEEPFVFPAASHAYQRTSGASPKFDGDKLGAVGSVRPGRYLLNDTNNGVEIVFHVTNTDGSDRLPAWRDFDHSGTLSPEEMQRSESMRTGPQVGNSGTWADSVLLHGGIDEPPLPDGTPPQHKFSIACLTASRKYRTIMHEKCKPFGGKSDLVLLNVAEALEIKAGLPKFEEEDPLVNRA